MKRRDREPNWAKIDEVLVGAGLMNLDAICALHGIPRQGWRHVAPLRSWLPILASLELARQLFSGGALTSWTAACVEAAERLGCDGDSVKVVALRWKRVGNNSPRALSLLKGQPAA